MNYVSKVNWTVVKTRLRPVAVLGGLAMACVLAGACVTYSQGQQTAARQDRGILFDHEIHAAQELDCAICHSDDGSGAMTMPAHETCSVCHEIPEGDDIDKSTCNYCHTRPDQSVTPLTSLLAGDVKFAHDPHTTAEVACATCHEKPDEAVLPAVSLKPFCMDCHGDVRPELNECSVCHDELDKDVVPKFRSGKRIQHDAPEIWENVHGQEALVSAEYCNLCHTSEAFCDECHRKEAPDNHTASWRRKTHGLQATWNRQNCAVCHEEDQCLRCHQNTEPASHHGGWDAPANRHCVSCHYPPERTNCTVCHEQIEHRSALPSPHAIGLYPANCALCHPGGLPHRAPHLVNSTVRCVVCHK